jgi:fibro-slime domain-containing protein
MIALPTSGNTRHPDFEIFAGSAATLNLVQSTLDLSDHKPVFAGNCIAPGVTTACPYNQQLTTEANFDQWYNDIVGVNLSIAVQLPFTQGAGNTYSYVDNSLFPFTGGGWVAAGNENASGGNNFGFTSEARYWFEYQGGEVLDFFGDDDLWVFVNGYLAVDVGGLHPQTAGDVTLDAAAATAYQLQVGNIYEISLFHAERHTNASNFELTLGGFVKSTSTCTPVCGDDVIAGPEQCDDGVDNANEYGTCQTNCQLGSFCGDGTHDTGFEACDNGFNQSGYNQVGCAPGCVLPPRCGDGTVNNQFGETCDDGVNDNSYGGCTALCQFGPRCGDGVTNGGEQCDDAVNDGTLGER